MTKLRAQQWLTLSLALASLILLIASVGPDLRTWQRSVACESQARGMLYQLVQDPATFESFDDAADALRAGCPPTAMAAGSWPVLANLYIQRGNHAWGKQQWDAAAEYYQLAVDFAPKQAPARRRLAEVLVYHLGQPAQALEQLQIATMLEPQDGYGYVLQAHAFTALGDAGRALEAAQQAVARSNHSYAYLVQGDMYAKLARWSEAVASYQQSIELDPTSGITYSYLGNALRELGRLDEARAAWQEAQRLDPSLSIPSP